MHTRPDQTSLIIGEIDTDDAHVRCGECNGRVRRDNESGLPRLRRQPHRSGHTPVRHVNL
ncbi:hypothetical protein SDC9_128521 [bioreactor metagenome]|uniref:Uncharacterized protein n=1 Tax=bioreactor metagenome TaxID=1076179 RepID=A0A645CX99_9ZZZZ